MLVVNQQSFEEFDRWRKLHKWLWLGRTLQPDGFCEDSYLTPSGNRINVFTNTDLLIDDVEVVSSHFVAEKLED